MVKNIKMKNNLSYKDFKISPHPRPLPSLHTAGGQARERINPAKCGIKVRGGKLAKPNLSVILKKRLPAKFYACLKDVSVLAQKFGLEPYLVGGVVRDLLLSSSAPIQNDFDITVYGGSVSPLASALAKKWKAKLFSHSEFLTFTIKWPDGTHLDLITARRETYPSPGSLPVVKMGTLQTDLYRRDFSINAIALSLSKDNWGTLVDPLKGALDIRKKKIRILHLKSFEDDPTRIFRAARFAGRFGFRLDNLTARLLLSSIKNCDIKNISYDRIRIELEKILLEQKPSPALKLLAKWNVLSQVYPKGLVLNREIARMIDYVTPSFLKELEKSKSESKNHDSKKLDSRLLGNDKGKRNHGFRDESHQKILTLRMSSWLKENSVVDTRNILTTLNFPSHVQEKIIQPLVLYNLFMDERPIVSLPRLKLFDETRHFFKLLMKLNKSQKIQKRWKEYRLWLESSPILNGESLKKMGYSPGPIFKKILDSLAMEKFKGLLKNRADEERFVIDNFRRD